MNCCRLSLFFFCNIFLFFFILVFEKTTIGIRASTLKGPMVFKDAMEAESSFSSIAPPVFDGDNYHFWAIRMETYLDAMDL